MGALAAAVERAWRPRSAGERMLRAVLVPGSAAYGAAVWLRNALYDTGWLPTTRVPAHVISVGNLTVGGTGKTPTALWLAEALAHRGRRVAIVARGYRKRRRGVVVVGTAGEPLVTPEEGGDEAVLLARRFRGPVITAERRADAAAAACERFGADTIVLDDGLQHRALARDADLVLVADDPAARRLLPAGSRREPLAALQRARAALVVGHALGHTVGDALGDAEVAWPPLPAHVPRFRGRVGAQALVRVEPGGWRTDPLDGLAGAAAVAVAGIARPERFAAALAACGVQVVRQMWFPDHHAYGEADVAAIAQAARDGLVLTTEKDLVKLAGRPGLRALRALRIGLAVEAGERLVTLLEGG